MKKPKRDLRAGQSGAAAVEFAIVALIFFTLLIGIMEMGRLLFYWNAASEATRWGARLAVVCDLNDSIITQKMKVILPFLTDGDISIIYEPSTCSTGDAAAARASCRSVTVSVRPSVQIQTFIPVLASKITMPPFSTSLPRESMNSAANANPVCK